MRQRFGAAFGRRPVFASIFAVMAILVGIFAATQCWPRPGLPCEADDAMSSEEQEVILYIDAHRTGLPPVFQDANLARAAQWKANDMAASNYLAHDDPNLRSWDQRVRDCGYGGGTIGETLAEGQRDAIEVERAWENSPEHNGILLGPGYNAVGIGVANSADGTRFWAADFGGP